jgi:hypothetical protein
MLSPDSQAQRARRQAEIPLIVVYRFPGPALTPILVREDGDRFVLVEGLHRLEAAKSLGETTIAGYRVSSRKH